MLADYFTKAQQGKLFRLTRDIIMGISSYPVEGYAEINEHENMTGEPLTQKIVPKWMYAQALCGNRIDQTKLEKIEKDDYPNSSSIWIILNYRLNLLFNLLALVLSRIVISNYKFIAYR